MEHRPERNFSDPMAQPFYFPGDEHGVLLIHGFTGSCAHMRLLGEHLRDQGFTVRGINLPGHGSRPEDMAKCTWKDWLQAAKMAAAEMPNMISISLMYKNSPRMGVAANR